MDLAPDFDEFIGSLIAQRAEFLVVGAYALAFHGAPRFTGDIDLFVRPTLENAERVLAAVRAFGFPTSELDPQAIIDPLPQIPSLGSWQRNHQDSEIGPATVHYYAVFDDHDRLLVLVSMNSDVSDSWEREGDSQDYFEAFAGKGYALGVNVAIWVMTH